MIDLLKKLNLYQYDCEHIDVRIEETRNVDIGFYQKELYNFKDEYRVGAFIRIKHNGMWYYAATTEMDNLSSEVQKLADSARVKLKSDNSPNSLTVHTFPSVFDKDLALHKPKEEKIAYLNKYRDILENDAMTLSPYIGWSDKVIIKHYINNKGVAYSYDWAFSGVLASYTLKDGENLFNTGFRKTFQTSDELDDFYEEFLSDFDDSKLFINAPTIEPGKYQVVLSPEATGIFAHESFGHKSEADFMIGDESMKSEWEIGKKVASDIVSIVDYGDDMTNTGYCPIDDEGVLTQKTYLIKNGILAGRLHSTETAEILNETVTGNARAIDFEWEPIVRMTNTYFEAGKLTLDELLAPIKNGYFIKTLSHGSGMSTFTLAANKSYKIENGKITDPVKINIVTGTVFQTLYDIDGLSDKVEINNSVFGGCGKNNQSPLPVADGGPYIRVKSMNLS